MPRARGARTIESSQPGSATAAAQKEDTMLKKILIATDGSPSALRAVELGLELAEEEGAQPIIVHVAPTKDVLPVAGIGMVPVSVPHELADADRASLDEAVELAEERGLDAATRLLTGNPAHEIVAFADVVDADLIVIGSHGYGTIAGALLGSVSRGVLNGTTRPVLIVREVAQAAEVHAYA
jgi:nucleotide-binding universal stress UspA family protein